MWLIYSPDFEPAITSLAILASLLSIYFDRIIAEKERRKEALIALIHELYMNLGVIKDLKAASRPDKVNKIHILPRLYLSSLSSAIASGMFTGNKDKKLWKLMTSWLQFSTDYNNRLDVTEFNVFSNPSYASEFNKKLTKSVTYNRTFDSLVNLIDHLLHNYHKLTKINSDTILFKED